MESKKRKGLHAQILTGKYHSPNGGISATAKEVLIVDPAVPEIFEQRDDVPTVKLVRRVIAGKDYIHAEPLEAPKGTGWMASGAYIESSDSRFPSKYPIPLHDRQEFVDMGGD